MQNRSGSSCDFAYNALSPLQEVPECKNCYEEALIFQRHKPIGTLVIRPRMLTFFGTNNGEFKYNIGAIVSPEGYLKDQIYYKIQLGYSIAFSMQKITQHQTKPPCAAVLATFPVCILDVAAETVKHPIAAIENVAFSAINVGGSSCFKECSLTDQSRSIKTAGITLGATAIMSIISPFNLLARLLVNLPDLENADSYNQTADEQAKLANNSQSPPVRTIEKCYTNIIISIYILYLEKKTLSCIFKNCKN